LISHLLLRNLLVEDFLNGHALKLEKMPGAAIVTPTGLASIWWTGDM
jgi:hypothetical protein